ncbi:unnamed protein product, partial [Prorocentrum cordatum]
MGTHLSALVTALQTPQPDKEKKHNVQRARPELEREQQLHQSAVAARKAQEALDKAIIFEKECKEWLHKVSADLQQKVQAAAATAAAHQRLLRSSLEAQPTSPLQPAAINLTAILETTEPEDLGRLVCFEDGDLFSFGDLELEQEKIEQWNRHKSELAAEVSKLIVAAVGPSAQGLAQRKQAFAEYRARKEATQPSRERPTGGLGASLTGTAQRRLAPPPLRLALGPPPASAAASTAGDPSGAAPEPAPPEASPEDLAKTLADARARAFRSVKRAGGVIAGVRRHIKSHSFKDLCRIDEQQVGAGRLDGLLKGGGPIDFWDFAPVAVELAGSMDFIFVALYLTPGEKLMGVNAEKLTNLGAFL